MLPHVSECGPWVLHTSGAARPDSLLSRSLSRLEWDYVHRLLLWQLLWNRESSSVSYCSLTQLATAGEPMCVQDFVPHAHVRASRAKTTEHIQWQAFSPRHWPRNKRPSLHCCAWAHAITVRWLMWWRVGWRLIFKIWTVVYCLGEPNSTETDRIRLGGWWGGGAERSCPCVCVPPTPPGWRRTFINWLSFPVASVGMLMTCTFIMGSKKNGWLSPFFLKHSGENDKNATNVVLFTKKNREISESSHWLCFIFAHWIFPLRSSPAYAAVPEVPAGCVYISTLSAPPALFALGNILGNTCCVLRLPATSGFPSWLWACGLGWGSVLLSSTLGCITVVGDRRRRHR